MANGRRSYPGPRAGRHLALACRRGRLSFDSKSVLGSYEIVEELGSGGMGIVYRAKDRKLGRDAVIKVLRPDLASDAERRQRFEQEARAASALNHPNLVTTKSI